MGGDCNYAFTYMDQHYDGFTTLRKLWKGASATMLATSDAMAIAMQPGSKLRVYTSA